MDRLFRRRALLFTVCIIFSASKLQVQASSPAAGGKTKIDRYSLVNRHNIRIQKADTLASLSVGNGDFAFTTDITGLQTFYKEYEKGVTLGTQSNWGWHTFPNNENYKLTESTSLFDFQGRKVPYLVQFKGNTREAAASSYFRENPQRLQLGVIRLLLTKADGTTVGVTDIEMPNHRFNLWDGRITSEFFVNVGPTLCGRPNASAILRPNSSPTFRPNSSPTLRPNASATLRPNVVATHGDPPIEKTPVKVEVFCHQQYDLISARIQSPLIERGQLKVEWIFPYAVPVDKHSGYDFASSDKHLSQMERLDAHSVKILRTLDNDHYQVKIHWEEDESMVMTEKHHFVLSANSGNRITFSCLFSPGTSPQPLSTLTHQHISTSAPHHISTSAHHHISTSIPTFAQTRLNNQVSWKHFWKTSGMVDFSACTDPRAAELERRFVLSQYLTKIQNSGSLPPQETGLVYNSWYGKFHLEMHWWHSAHFGNWNHPEYIGKQLDWYSSIYNKALETAQSQGFKGVRWPKMAGPEGQNSPSNIGSFLIWQQPHIIYLAEQLYRINPSVGILKKYKDLIFAAAEFMADFAVEDSAGVFNILPPMIPAQEHWKRETSMNPPFELSYWHWALTTAQEWHKRVYGKIHPKWERVRNHLGLPVEKDGVYLAIANAPDSYKDPTAMRDHPMILGTLGILPLWDKIDPEIMRNTLKTIMNKWDWPMTWGWDYPMAAMCAARLNEPEIALEALLKNVQKNTYLKNGHNFQGRDLRIYLPGNGAFLKAITMMCAGWEGSTQNNPGFPKDGKWNIRWEGLKKDF